MSRQIKKTLVHAALEPTYRGNVDTVATDAAAMINPTHRIVRTTVPREIWFPHMGASEEMVAGRFAEVKFELEITGSGDPAVEPPWSRYLRACGFARTIISGTHARIEWNPISDNFESIVIRYWRAGLYYSARGARGTAKIKLPAFGIPRFEFTFMGLETWVWTTQAGVIPAYDLSAWRRPTVLTDEASGDIRLGGSLTNGAPVGGTILPSRGLEIDIGNRLEPIELMGGERISIGDREVTGTMSTAVTAVDEMAWRNDINNNVNTTLGFNWGTAVGERFSVFGPRVQRVDPQAEDYKGELLLSTGLRFQPTPVGNNDFTLVMR